MQHGYSSREKIVEHLSKNIDSETKIILGKYVESRRELVKVKKDACAATTAVTEKTPEEKARIIGHIIAENREKIMVEIREIESKLAEYQKYISRGGPAARLYAKQVEITNKELEILRKKYDDAELSLIVELEKTDLMKSSTTDYDEKWQKHCLEFANYNCGKFDIIVNELIESGFITVVADMDTIMSTDFDEKLQLTTSGIAATEINDIDGIIFIDTMLEIGKTLKNGTGARPTPLDIGLLISLLLIDESAGATGAHDGDIVYNIMPTTTITDVLRYLGANERNTVVSGYDNMMYCLANVLVNCVVPVRIGVSPRSIPAVISEYFMCVV